MGKYTVSMVIFNYVIDYQRILQWNIDYTCTMTAKFHNLGGKYLKMISKLQVCAELLNQRLISRSVDAEQMFLVML